MFRGPGPIVGTVGALFSTDVALACKGLTGVGVGSSAYLGASLQLGCASQSTFGLWFLYQQPVVVFTSLILLPQWCFLTLKRFENLFRICCGRNGQRWELVMLSIQSIADLGDLQVLGECGLGCTAVRP
jgi:hypothetical protein